MFVRIAIVVALMVTVGDAGTLEKTPPTKSQIRDRTSMLLKREALAKSESARLAATLALVDLARSVQTDRRHATSPMLKRTWSRISARLRAIQKRTIARGRRRDKQPTTIPIEPAVLAQLDAAIDAAPRANRNRANVRAGGPADFGPDLVALIQATISPSSWDVNGGPSSIQYWRPGMALVVRAPQGVHSQVGPLLGQLRAE